MENKGFDGEGTLKSMEVVQELLEKALEEDNEKLREIMEALSKELGKAQKKAGKRTYKKIAKKTGLPSEILSMGVSAFITMIREAIDEFDDNDLREFVELFIEQAKESKDFYSSLF